jgi:hypothetical protein
MIKQDPFFSVIIKRLCPCFGVNIRKYEYICNNIELWNCLYEEYRYIYCDVFALCRKLPPPRWCNRGYCGYYTAINNSRQRSLATPVNIALLNNGAYYVTIFCVVRTKTKEGAANTMSQWVISQLRVSVDSEITESSWSIAAAEVSEVQQLRVQLYRVNGRDSNRRRRCHSADGSNCVIVNYVSVKANLE